MAIPDAAQISQLRRMVRSSLSSLRLLSSRFAINVTSQFFVLILYTMRRGLSTSHAVYDEFQNIAHYFIPVQLEQQLMACFTVDA